MAIYSFQLVNFFVTTVKAYNKIYHLKRSYVWTLQCINHLYLIIQYSCKMFRLTQLKLCFRSSLTPSFLFLRAYLKIPHIKLYIS